MGQVNVIQIQRMVGRYTGKQGLNDKDRFQSVSDEYKMFADNYKSKYEEYIGKKLTQEEWETTREKGLQEQRDLLKEKNPILCLTYEIQNSLMYGKILNRENIKILDNDLDRNKAMFSRTYDYLYKIGCTKISELKNPEEIKLKQQMNEMYKNKSYPKHLDEVGRDGRISQSRIIQNIVIFKMQQMGNLDLKEFYNEHIAEQENSILAQIELLLEQGKNEDEIVQLEGINKIAYSDFKRQDEKKLRDIEEMRKSKTDEEIALKLRMEKRDFDELTQGKSSLKRYIEYRMPFKEIVQVAENTKGLEYENVNETLEIDEINPLDWTAEMHDQKSEQFFEDKQSGKYNIPPSIEKTDNEYEQNNNFNNEQNALVKYKPNRLRTFFNNFINKIKESNLFKRVGNKSTREEIENSKINEATAKMEALKQKFDSDIVVSQEEQEKHRTEYEQSKQNVASISISRGEQEGQEH